MRDLFSIFRLANAGVEKYVSMVTARHVLTVRNVDDNLQAQAKLTC